MRRHVAAVALGVVLLVLVLYWTTTGENELRPRARRRPVSRAADAPQVRLCEVAGAYAAPVGPGRLILARGVATFVPSRRPRRLARFTPSLSPYCRN